MESFLTLLIINKVLIEEINKELSICKLVDVLLISYSLYLITKRNKGNGLIFTNTINELL